MRTLKRGGFTRGMKRPTEAEAVDRKTYVAKLMQAGLTKDQGCEACAQQFGTADSTAERYYRDVLKGWGANYEEERRTFKVQQAQRLRGFIAKAASKVRRGKSDVDRAPRNAPGAAARANRQPER